MACPAQVAEVEGLLAADPLVGMTRFAWLKAMPVAPKADHVGELLDRLHLVRGIGLPPETAGRVHEERLRQLVREARPPTPTSSAATPRTGGARSWSRRSSTSRLA